MATNNRRNSNWYWNKFNRYWHFTGYKHKLQFIQSASISLYSTIRSRTETQKHKLSDFIYEKLYSFGSCKNHQTLYWMNSWFIFYWLNSCFNSEQVFHQFSLKKCVTIWNWLNWIISIIEIIKLILLFVHVFFVFVSLLIYTTRNLICSMNFWGIYQIIWHKSR